MKHYLNKDVLIYETIISQGKGKPTDKLCSYWSILIDNYSNGQSNNSWGPSINNGNSYDNIMDAKQNAFLILTLKGYMNFDVERNQRNPFNYYSEIIKRSFWFSFNTWYYEKLRNKIYIGTVKNYIPLSLIEILFK